MSISAQLIHWYNIHQRSLPWRKTSDPYRIWLSEIILQQTRVDQGMPYYQRFIEHFPTIRDLAAAPEDQVMKLWQGLGYYSRARNLHKAAKMVVTEYKGNFPSDYQTIKALPGIGDYTAAAIASFAFGLPHAVCDGNVIRVISRFFGIFNPSDTTEGKKIITSLAADQLNSSDPATHNQAIMEFGAIMCKPVNPGCNSCPLNGGCYAYINNKVSALPVKSKQTRIRNRYFNYLFIRSKNSFFLNKRGAGDIWQNLYDLPLIETAGQNHAERVMNSASWEELLGKSPFQVLSVSELKVHKLSHQHIYARVFDIRLDHEPEEKLVKNFIKTPLRKAGKYAVPKIIDQYFQEKLGKYILPQ